MPSQIINLVGKLAGIKQDDAQRIAVYLVRGNEILAHTNVQDDGSVHIRLPRQVLEQTSAYGLEVIVGPAGAAENLQQIPNLQRLPLDSEQLRKAESEFHLHLDKVELNEEILKIWWFWCRWYCISGVVVGPDGCPVPFADVTVYNVVYSGNGFTKTPRATVTTDINGHFDACFIWCRCHFCCWPCWPFWWLCWPWWWELDILRVIEEIESRVAPTPLNPVARIATQSSLALNRPAARDLMLGQGFAFSRRADAKFTPDSTRTALIRSKFSNASIRALFPWWWWCCDDPNIVFSASQGSNTILDEDPAVDTRWCLEDGSTVTLVANSNAITACSGDPKPQNGFVWTRVGDTSVANIHGGYADGVSGSDYSDMAFTGELKVYGEFATGSSVAYYQVNAGQWSGNPSRGGMAPGSSTPISLPLYNTAIILNGSTASFVPVKMGPFNAGGVTNLYATQEQRSSVPAGLLPPLPTGTVVGWEFNGLKVDANASNLLTGGNTGAIDLTMTGYDASFALLSLPPNTADVLTLEIDTTAITTAAINSLSAFTSGGVEVFPTESGNCPAYNVGAGGYVVLNVTVQDANGHLFEYVVTPNYGSGSLGTTTPGLRGYSESPGSFPAGYAGPPDTAQKSFGGGTENITYYPPENCCYDFRLDVGKRVTNGEFFPSLYTATFQTASINVS